MDMSTTAFIAGSISSSLFASSLIPMLRKAYRTKDMKSYSLSNIVLTNVGNLIHSIYVYSLPAGPIWVLHTFYLVAMALMLIWYLRYELNLRRLVRDVWAWRHVQLCRAKAWLRSWLPAQGEPVARDITCGC